MFYRTALFVLLPAIAACTAYPDAADEGHWDGYKEWAPKDAPSLLDGSIKYEYASLPSKGEAARIPWAGNYWPTYRDNINYPWAGENTQPPSTKYAAAFGREGLEDRVSREAGIDSRTSATTCETDDVCDDAKGETCAIRTGETEGRCVPTWFGICHAWAPAAIMEPEPEHAVTYNGVEFKVNDIKALVSASYDEGVDVKFMSLRCKETLSEDGQVGEDGHPVDDACQDTNAGSFHLAITNIIGIQGESLVEDRTIDFEVWNQPLRGYEVTLDEAVDEKRAIELTGGTGDHYTLNAKAASFRRIKMRLDYITESHQETDGNFADVIDDYTRNDRYEYLLELDADGKVVGGEWLGSSRTAHPDFLWRPYNKRSSELARDKGVKGTGIAWEDVQLLLKQSLHVPDSTGGFDWGDACAAGDGSFEQPIKHKDTVEVGIVPAGKASVRIALNAAADVDVQLIDEASGHKIIAWPDADLNGAEEACATWSGVEYCYSGYNGDGTNLGHEWIEVRGTTNRPLVMKAFGYEAGRAVVDYSWQAPKDCVDAGEGTFTQHIAHEDVVEVGVIPKGKNNIKIELTSDEDVDIQLYAGSVALVQWPDGRLSEDGLQTLDYQGMTITWSGYNGDGTHLGHEFITIEGTVSTDLTMKAFGYAEGEAEVNYWWGLDGSEL